MMAFSQTVTAVLNKKPIQNKASITRIVRQILVKDGSPDAPLSLVMPVVNAVENEFYRLALEAK